MQDELPIDFLVAIARKYGLTKLEETAFVETFCDTKTDQVIIKILGLTLAAYRARMGNVYVKFSFRDGGRGKKERLRYFLKEQYEKENPHRLTQVGYINIDALVDELNERLQEKIQNECGSMRVLAMTQPLELSNIFTEVNILEQIPRHQRLRIDDLLTAFESGNGSFSRFDLSRRTIEKVSGIDYVQKIDKLLLWGKPGAGKTTFLKHLATQCSARKIFPNYLPIFIVLKNFAETRGHPSLLEYIIQEHDAWGVKDYEIDGLLRERRILLLLDGLDEVKIEDTHRINREIQSFTDSFHGNRFLLTCRIAAQEYIFDKFTEVEIADFNQEQVNAFSRNWFTHKEVPDKANQFLERLQQSPRIQELATNPLLLTLLCIVFETEADFPASRAELYEEGIFTLLRRWDASRNIERSQIYQELSVARKVGMLSHIALKAFERSEIFFKKQTLSTYIADYIVNLPETRKRKLMPYELERQGELVLKSIEAQHGLLVERAYDIYSFSHLSFQEYFAAKAISSEYDFGRLQLVFEQVKNKQWHEVFLLAVSMSARADGLITVMKEKTDGIPLTQLSLIKFLRWVTQKAQQVKAQQVKAQRVKANLSDYFVRAFYYMYSFSKDEIISPLNSKPMHHPEMEMDRVLIGSSNTLKRALKPSLTDFERLERLHQIKLDLQRIEPIVGSTAYDDPTAFQPQWVALMRDLNLLIELPASDGWMDALNQWVTQFRHWIIAYRNIGYEWNFNAVELEMLQEYYNANKLLMDCLQNDCYVSRQVQNKIKKTLFTLPEIEAL
jgi:hypothetical protein